MADSLILAGFELIGGASAFRLGTGYDFGTAEPDTSAIASLFLDGEVIVGDRTHNRTITLPLEVLGAGSRIGITTQINALGQAVNVRTGKTFTLQWTPNGGLPIVFDCHRATFTRRNDITRDGQLAGHVDVTFQAAPFGKSTAPQTISAALAQVQLDSYATAPTGATLDTSIKYEGTGSAKITLAKSSTATTVSYSTSAPVSRSFSPVNISSAKTLTLRDHWVSPSGWFQPLTFSLTLNSAFGFASLSGSTGIGSTWDVVSFSLASTGTLDLTAVTSYSLDCSTTQAGVGNPASFPSTATINIDDLRALPPSSAGISTSHGAVLTVPGILGSARAPVTLTAVKSGGGTLSSLILHSPPADQDPDVAILQALDGSLADQTLTVAAANAAFDGTYGVWLAIASTSGSAAQTVAITVTQLENGTPVGSATTVTTTYTAPDADKLVYVGNITLPLYAVPVDNTTTSYTIRVNRTAGVDLFSDIMFCDTRGQTIQATPPAAAAAIYVEEPDPVTGFGQVLTTASNRSAAYSTLGSSLVTGGPIQFEPGSNRLLALSPDGPPSVTATLYPRWLDERAS